MTAWSPRNGWERAQTGAAAGDGGEPRATASKIEDDLPRPAGRSLLRALVGDLFALPGPSGAEEPVRRYVRDRLVGCGLPPACLRAPAAGPKNLVAYLPPDRGVSPRPLLFSAHLDVVRAAPPTRWATAGSRLASVDREPLGVDDRAGCALLLAVAELALGGALQHRGIVLAFTAEEERGLVGAWRASLPTRPEAAFVLDDEGPAGRFTPSAPGADHTELTTRRRVRAPAYRLPPESLPLRLLARAARRAGVRLEAAVGRSLSDAHVWNARGVPAVNLGIGMEDAHTPEESLDLLEFERTLALVLGLIEDGPDP